MAIRDYAYTDGTATSGWISSSTSGLGSLGIGNIDNTRDNDDSTYGNIAASKPAGASGGEAEGTGYIEVDVSKSRFIENMVFIIEIDASVSGGSTKAQFYLDYYNGAWNNLFTSSLYTDSSMVKSTYTYSVGYSNVTAIRVRGYVYVYNANAADASHVAVNIYSQELNGYYFEQSNIKIYDGSNVIYLGKEPSLSSSDKLRYYDGSNICSLGLIDSGHVYATKLRVYDGSNIKAVPIVVT